MQRLNRLSAGSVMQLALPATICTCKCTGSIQYVHENCLQQWLKSKRVSIHPSCEVCSTEYRFHKVHGLGLSNLSNALPGWRVFFAELHMLFRAFALFMLFAVQCAIITCVAYFIHGIRISDSLGLSGALESRFASVYVACVACLLYPLAPLYSWSIFEACKRFIKVRTPIYGTYMQWVTNEAL